MTLPELDDTVTWAGAHYRVIGVITEPALILEDVKTFQRITVAASKVTPA